MESDILHKTNSNNSSAINNNNNNNNGPRVSFNRDVHVKRYGPKPNYDEPSDPVTSPQQHSVSSQHQATVNLRRELPKDLSDEALKREAALVLEQVNKFGSLPLRRNRGKPVQRSISDASTKKSKINSILNLFNPNTSNSNSSTINRSRRVERSKSDASRRRRGSGDSNSSTGSKTKREKLKIRLRKTNPNNTNLLTANSSDSDNNNFLSVTTPKKIQLSPITETQSRSDYFDLDEPDASATKKVKEKLSIGNIGFTSHEDLDLIPTTEEESQKMQTSMKMVDEHPMHPSQQPPDKPILTKGFAVDNMIKRLSTECVSPPPQVLTVGGFSYLASSPPTATSILTQIKQKSLSPLTTTNANPDTAGNDTANDIVYAQVVRNETKHANGNKTIQKETIHNTIKKYRSTSPPNISTTHINITNNNNNNTNNTNHIDTVDFVTATTSNENYYKSKTHDIDEGLGLGNEVKIKYNDHHQLNEEPFIQPQIRHRGPNKYTSINYHNHSAGNNFDMRDMDVNDLSYRREILESRIRSRIDGLNRNGTPHETFATYRHRQRTLSPPAHRYDSNEIINRYSPERTHRDIISPIADDYYMNQKPAKYRSDYVDSTLRRSKHYYSKNDKVDSGIENDFRRNSYEKPKRMTRFDIGRPWNYQDDIIECELFLMKERKHTEETYPYQLVRTYVYRERSIDDGSQYDPNADKAKIIKELRHNEKIVKDFLKAKKKHKKSSIDKMKELVGLKPRKSTTSVIEEEELRRRYREYSPNPSDQRQRQQSSSSLTVQQQHQHDIANRRRLSTPTSSPLTNRSSSLPPKSMKIHSKTTTTTTNTKSSTLKRDKVDKENMNNHHQKFSWFASLDRLAKKKSKVDATPSERRSSLSKTRSTSLKNLPVSNGSSKTLRFFGDTDADDAGMSRSSRSNNKKILHPTQQQQYRSSTLTRNRKSYQNSAHELNSVREDDDDDDDHYKSSRIKSTSLVNLNAQPPKRTKTKNISRSRSELQNISESTSDTEFNGNGTSRRHSSPVPPARPPKSKHLTSSTLPRNRRKQFDDDDADKTATYKYRDGRESLGFRQKQELFQSDSLTNLSSASKLRERSLSSSRERDRNFDSDASQRSVVYLHAATVGDIPQSISMDSRSRISGRSSVKTAIREQQPMARTVERSVSLSAPWQPKFRREGYEIDYAKEERNKSRYPVTSTPRTKSLSRELLSERHRDRRLERSDSKRI